MLARSLARLALALLPLSGAACILTTADTGGELAMLRAQQREQADRIARALCASYYACGCEDLYPPHEDEAECLEQVSDELVARLEQGIDGGLDYDPACLDAQAELLEALGCASSSDVILDPELTRLSDAAARCHTFHGTVDPGEGECEPLPSARADDCSPGHACTEFAMCVTTEPLGESQTCDPEGRQPCAPGLWCLESWVSGALTCKRLPGPGQSCQEAGVCDFDGWCDTTDFICRPWSTVGQACMTIGYMQDSCGYQAHCSEGTCAALSAEGQPCGPGCAEGLHCDDDGVCARDRAVACDFQESLP